MSTKIETKQTKETPLV